MESINLNLIPQGANPVVHAKQFDEGRGFRFNLFNGTAPIVLTGAETITCNVKKPDGNLVTVAVTNTSSNYVEVYTTLQMCACYGANLGEIRLEEDGNDIGTLNFTLSVEESPLNNGIESESSIHNLESMVDEMVAEEVATQYDSGNVIFDTEPTKNHGIGYTVTSEGIKTAIDNAFDYDNTASGSLVHITDGADNIPVKSLVSQIVAVESGSGEKSPTNPYSISGFNNGIITRLGKNWLNPTATSTTINGITYTVNDDGTISTSGVATAQSSLNLIFNITLKTSMILSGCATGGAVSAFGIQALNANSTSIVAIDYGKGVTLPTGTYGRIRITFQNGANANGLVFKPMLRLASVTDSTYEKYNGNTYTFTFGQTVYGGHFDNKGNLVVTHGTVDLGDLSWTSQSTSSQYSYSSEVLTNAKKPSSSSVVANILASIYETTNTLTFVTKGDNIIGLSTSGRLNVNDNRFTTASDFRTGVTGIKVVYELDTPITLAISSQDIPTLLGENNIFSNCGDVEVEYYTSKSNDILEFIDSEIGKKNGDNIPIDENSPDSIKDYIDNEVSTITTSLSGKANKTEDATITVESGYTLISSSCGKTDRLVHLNFNVEKTGGFATGWQAIGTTDFKPNTLAYCPLWNVTNGVANGEVRIDTDGTINFYVITGGELRLNANIGYITN